MLFFEFFILPKNNIFLVNSHRDLTFNTEERSVILIAVTEDRQNALSERERTAYCIMDQITIKTPIPKCRLYWCLIESEIGDTVSHVGIFDKSCELAPL